MADVAQLQKELDDIKSEIENIQLQLENAPVEENTRLQEKINTLKDHQLELTQEIEEVTGLSGVMGDVQKG